MANKQNMKDGVYENIELMYDQGGIIPSTIVPRFKFKNLKELATEKEPKSGNFNVGATKINNTFLEYYLNRGLLKALELNFGYLLTYDAATNIKVIPPIEKIEIRLNKTTQQTFYLEDIMMFQYEMVDSTTRELPVSNNLFIDENPTATKTYNQVIYLPFGGNLTHSSDSYIDELPLRNDDIWSVKVYMKKIFTDFITITTGGSDTLIPTEMRLTPYYVDLPEYEFQKILDRYKKECFTIYDTTTFEEEETFGATTKDLITLKTNLQNENLVGMFFKMYLEGGGIQNFLSPVGKYGGISGMFYTKSQINDLVSENSVTQIARTKKRMGYTFTNDSIFVYRPNITNFYDLEVAGCKFITRSDLQIQIASATEITAAKYIKRGCALLVRKIYV